MRIGFYYPGLNLGGQQTQTLQIIEELVSMGHDCCWVYHYDGELKKKVDEIATTWKIAIPTPGKGLFRATRWCRRLMQFFKVSCQLRSFCKVYQPDVLLSGAAWGSLICNHALKHMNVLHFRLMGCSMVEVEPFWLRHYQLISFDRGISGYFGWPAVFKELASVGVPEEKFIPFPMAVDSKKFFPQSDTQRAKLREKLGISGQDLVIGWVGRIERTMQVWDTVRLADLLTKRGFSRFKLLFVGGGPDEEELKKMLFHLGLDEKAIMMGWVPYEKVNDFINVMDVVPLLQGDPQGGSIVREAMACGRVALSVSGPSETQSLFMKPDATILVPSEGYLDAAASAILNLVNNPGEIVRLGEKARQYAFTHMSFRQLAEIIVSASQKNLASLARSHFKGTSIWKRPTKSCLAIMSR